MRKHTFQVALIAFTAIAVVACGDDGEVTGQQGQGIISSTMASMQQETRLGARLTQKKCASCHELKRNLRKVGPPLKGIFGRTPLISGVPFESWDEQALDLWLANPNKVKPKTTMAIPGVQSAEERMAIIDYLKLL